MRKILSVALLLGLVSTISVAARPSKEALEAARRTRPGTTVTITAGRVTTLSPPKTINGVVINSTRTDVVGPGGIVQTGRTNRFSDPDTGVESTITTNLEGVKTFHVLAPVRPPGYVLGRPPVTMSGPYTPEALAAAKTAVVAEAARRAAILVKQ